MNVSITQTQLQQYSVTSAPNSNCSRLTKLTPRAVSQNSENLSDLQLTAKSRLTYSMPVLGRVIANDDLVLCTKLFHTVSIWSGHFNGIVQVATFQVAEFHLVSMAHFSLQCLFFVVTQRQTTIAGCGT